MKEIKKTYFLGITGHANIEECNGFELLKDGSIYNPEAYKKVFSEIKRVIKKTIAEEKIELSQLRLISGMARGVDEIFALFAMKYNLPLILSIPNSLNWHQFRSKRKGTVIPAQALEYQKIINYVYKRQREDCLHSKICEIKKEYNGKTYYYANFARNQHIIDTSTKVFSYLKYQSAGTLDGIKCAKKSNKYLGNVSNYNNLKNLLFPLNINYSVPTNMNKSHIVICHLLKTQYNIDSVRKGSWNYTDINIDNKKNQSKYLIDFNFNFEFEKNLFLILTFFINKRTKNSLITFSIFFSNVEKKDMDYYIKSLEDSSNIFENNNIEINAFFTNKNEQYKDAL